MAVLKLHPTEVDLLRRYAARPDGSHRFTDDALFDRLRPGAFERLEDAGFLASGFPGWKITAAGRAFAKDPNVVEVLMVVEAGGGLVEFEARDPGRDAWCDYCCQYADPEKPTWVNCYRDRYCDRCARRYAVDS